MLHGWVGRANWNVYRPKESSEQAERPSGCLWEEHLGGLSFALTMKRWAYILGGMSDCSCRSDDPYACWVRRYPSSLDGTPNVSGRQSIEEDGGPCACVCHDIDSEPEELGW